MLKVNGAALVLQTGWQPLPAVLLEAHEPPAGVRVPDQDGSAASHCCCLVGLLLLLLTDTTLM